MSHFQSSALDLHDHRPPEADFRSDILAGLRKPQKWLSSLYFYDARGSELFDEICELPEYYLTRTELAIMDTAIEDMCDHIGPHVLLIEFGSGSGLKTRKLLEHLDQPSAYVPVEISRDTLLDSVANFRGRFPGLEIMPVCADFTDDFTLPEPNLPQLRNVVYFPGSTIGNFEPPDALALLKQMHKLVCAGGGVLLGVDLRKDPAVLERAYNDEAGVTAEFNKNMLVRINRELDADFDLDAFRHRAVWNSDESCIEMRLISQRDQTVTVAGESIPFEKDEFIITETSYKLTRDWFAELAGQAGFRVAEVWTDEREWFSVQYLECE